MGRHAAEARHRPSPDTGADIEIDLTDTFEIDLTDRADVDLAESRLPPG